MKTTAELVREKVCPFRFYGTKSYHYQSCLGDNCMAWNGEESCCELIRNPNLFNSSGDQSNE